MTIVATIDRPARRWLRHLFVLGAYTLLALAVTYPLPLQLGTAIVANHPGQVDGYLGIWNLWWTATALTSGQDPFYTPLLFYPQGLDLFWQTLSLPQGLLALPLTLTLGPLPAYNLLILLSFILGGYFTFCFLCFALRQPDEPTPAAKLLSVTELSAFVGGAIYAFAPFHLQKVLDAQLEVASIQWLPLWAYATLVLLERRRWPWALLSAALLLWVGLGTWYYGLFTLIATGLMAGLWALRVTGTRRRLELKTLGWGLAPIVLWLIVMTPRLLSLANTGDQLLGDARIEQQDAIADLLAFWLPNPNHPLWGATVSALYTAAHPGAILWNVALGLVGTVLACIGVAVAWRAQWRWLALGVAAAALALGSEVIVGGWRTGIPGPYALIRDLPGVRSSHRPNHFVLITLLTTALFAAAGTRSLLVRLPRRGVPWATAGLLAALFAIDAWAGPLPLFRRPMPTPYLTLPPADGALLTVPLHLNFSNSENLWYQTQHHWPLVGGFIGREPPYMLARYAPGIKELRFGRVERDDILSPAWPALARETLAAYNLRFVLFHHEAMGSTFPLMRQIGAELGLKASYEDDLITVYPVPTPPVVRPLAYLGPGWGALERNGAQRWRWMGATAQVYLLNPSAAPRPGRLTLDMEAYAAPRTLTLRLGSGPPFTLAVSRTRMVRHMHVILPPGETVLYLAAPAGSLPDQPTRSLSLAVMGLGIE